MLLAFVAAAMPVSADDGLPASCTVTPYHGGEQYNCTATVGSKHVKTGGVLYGAGQVPGGATPMTAPTPTGQDLPVSEYCGVDPTPGGTTWYCGVAAAGQEVSNYGSVPGVAWPYGGGLLS